MPNLKGDKIMQVWGQQESLKKAKAHKTPKKVIKSVMKDARENPKLVSKSFAGAVVRSVRKEVQAEKNRRVAAKQAKVKTAKRSR